MDLVTSSFKLSLCNNAGLGTGGGLYHGVECPFSLQEKLFKVKMHEVTKWGSTKKVNTDPSPKEQLKSWALNQNTQYQGTYS